MLLMEIDWRDPFAAFAPLAGEAHAHLLHGGDLSMSADWSVIVAFPTATIAAGQTDDDPFPMLDELLSERCCVRRPEHADMPFMSGLIGFIGYEAARHFEPNLQLPSCSFPAPEVVFGAYDAAALFSRNTRRAYVTGRNKKACYKLREALGVGAYRSSATPRFSAQSSNFTKEEYKTTISGVIENILDGDYYQANISQRFRAEAATAPVDSLSLFRSLAAGSDAFFGALLQLPESAVISNSPERFFRVSKNANGGRRIVVEPIKGTRKRGETPAQDAALTRALETDPKDRAENIMIADLLRNDLSRVCADGTIREAAVCELMSLVNVHHLVSRVSGELRPEITIGDVFRALFPCGSVTGAPKIEAMKAIARTEKIGRGPYCGAIGYIDDSGASDFAVSIRTMLVEGAHVTIPVGGGVTLRSDPAQEYEETIIKAAGALGALGLRSNGLI